jgi:hypothetical protein
MARTPEQPPARLSETAVAEGNVLEHPIFKLSNKEARPHRGKDKSGNYLRVEGDYTTQHVLSPGSRVVIEASIQHGYPTVFGMRVLLAIIEKSRSLGFPARRVPITMAEIARSLGEPEAGGRLYKLIKHAVATLNSLRLAFENAWYDTATKTTVMNTGAEHIITAYSLGGPKGGPQQQLSFGYTEDFVELGERLFESLRAGYRIGVDLDYLNALRSSTAQRLYAYLTKKDGGGRAQYSENLISLAGKLPLGPRFPSQIRRIIEPALRELERPQEKGRKCFLSQHYFESSGKDTALTVVFAGASMRDYVHSLAKPR